MKMFFIASGVLLAAMVAGSWAWEVINDKTPACVQEMHRLRRKGYSEKEIDNWARKYMKTMAGAGFSDEEMKKCFGASE